MPRYFLEVAYDGKRYAGFQKQANANTIQAEVEKVFTVYFKAEFNMTGSSRTDAGVHALQNFFHFDTLIDLYDAEPLKLMYHLNAMLPPDIVIKNINVRDAGAHCRFDALSRKYQYRIYQQKNPFINEHAYYYPYELNLEKLNAASRMLFEFSDFEAFSKRSTQVRTFECTIEESYWQDDDEVITFYVRANRFLRGMVRGLVGTMVLVGRGKITPDEFVSIILSKDSSRVNFAVPAHGLALIEVKYASAGAD